ncbi:unnamed protein product [Anisakis simplex]|uniref:Cadherin domain-containing protein n=1 Tax=Anisakis simplex TaxID=6269 RepID=A0A3P6SX98_ANISI|nr:unnamed protein product [Anisakis simplex]
MYLAKSFEATQLAVLEAKLTVSDENHHTEPDDEALVIIRLVRREEQIADVDLLKFDDEIVPKIIAVPEDTPIGSYVYTVNVRPVATELLDNLASSSSLRFDDASAAQAEFDVSITGTRNAALSNNNNYYNHKQHLHRRITYSLSEGHRLFTINPITGVISTVAGLRSTGESNVTVVANQPASQTSVPIWLVVRAVRSASTTRMYSLTSESLVLNITENVAIGTLISSSIVSSSATAAQLPTPSGDTEKNTKKMPSLGLSYRIFGQDSAYLRIDEKGAIYTALEVDHEIKPRLAAFIYVFHSTSDHISIIPITVNVLDENDSEPQFPKKLYAAKVMENSPINTFIVKAQAMDSDDSELEYSLMMNSDSAALSSLLTVDHQGQIRSAEPLLGLEGDYQFAVIARDGKHNGASASVFLTILPTSRCQPTLPESTPTVFTINENQQAPTVLTHFKANLPAAKSDDDECELKYAIWDGFRYVNETQFFTMNALTGELSTRVAFDYETSNRYSLVLAAQSGELFAQLDVEVRVMDLDDNPIEVIDKMSRFDVAEDERAGKIIGRIRAQDRDATDSVYYHLLTDADGKFEVDTTSGTISLRDQLDRERQDSYELKILVSNSAEWHSSSLSAETETGMRRENDHPAASTIQQQQLQDQLSKSDQMADQSEEQRQHGGVLAIVMINVLDVNDNGPIFDKELYVKAIAHTALAGTKLLSVHARDPDLTNQLSADGDIVVYRIDDIIYRYLDRSRQASDFLAVNEHSGLVSLSQPVAEFRGGVFEARIISSDIKPQNTLAHTATTKLKVWIYDESDDVIELEIESNIEEKLKSSRTQEIIHLLSDLCECSVILLGADYGRLMKMHEVDKPSQVKATDTAAAAASTVAASNSLQQQPSSKHIRVHFIFVNRTNNQILTAERAISIVDKKAAINPDLVVPRLIAASAAAAASAQPQSDGHRSAAAAAVRSEPNHHHHHQPSTTTSRRSTEVALLLYVFAFLLITVLLIFALILCYYRSRFLSEKRSYEEQKIAVGSLNKLNRYKQPPPYIAPPLHNLREKYAVDETESSYGTQEVQMIVEDESIEKRVRYS